MLKRLRTQLGYTQQEMADSLSTTRVQISRWESGLTQPLLAGLFCALAPQLLSAFRAEPPKLYTSKQLREACAAEIINCMGLAKDSLHPAIQEYGKTLVVRVPAILDAADDPLPPDPTLLRAMLVLGRLYYRSPRKQ